MSIEFKEKQIFFVKEFYTQALELYVQKQQKDFLKFTRAQETWAKLGDTVSSVQDHRNKAIIMIKQVTIFFVCFPVHLKVMFTQYYSLLNVQ